MKIKVLENPENHSGLFICHGILPNGKILLHHFEREYPTVFMIRVAVEDVKLVDIAYGERPIGMLKIENNNIVY